MVQKRPPQSQSNVTFSDDNTSELAEAIYNHPPPDDADIALSDISERDKIWNSHRHMTQRVAQIYAISPEFERYSERMTDCSTFLLFAFQNGFKLQSAPFCHVRGCPVCQWRKSLFWKAMMYQLYDKLKEEYPTHRWLFMTLTVKNVPIDELRLNLKHMNKSWHRLVKRKQFNLVDGWVRTTEVTRDKKNPNTHCHPHFHIILMVKPSYFSHGYIKHREWAETWGSCLKVDYVPNVDIRTVKPKIKSDGVQLDDTGMRGAIAETLKYAVKPDDMIGDGTLEAIEWFHEYTRQVHRMNFVATGGLLKNALKASDDVSDENMIHTGNDDDDEKVETDERRLAFTYRPTKSSYYYAPHLNQ